MNKEILKKHTALFNKYLKKESEISKSQYQERLDSINYYKNWKREKILGMTEDDMYEYISKLWAMLIWGNKHYYVDKVIADNGFENFKRELAELVWGSEEIEKRWDRFRKKVKGIGPAMISELLCKTHPDKYALWNRRAYNGLNLLGVKDLPVYNYQLTGKKYKELSGIIKIVADELKKEGFEDPTLLAADYFLWHEFYAENLTEVFKKEDEKGKTIKVGEKIKDDTTSEFIHNDVRDAIRDIGLWLGFNASTEKKVADGSVVDTVWESTIGNMGRIMYVFEVQTKGSIDSLIVNLLKARNNPAVQGVIAVSDEVQLEKIKKHVATVSGLSGLLRYWDYKQVWKVRESLEFVNGEINNLKLVPDGF